jgi:ABC-type uncharacterized transport system fused permease/ATPase subunit
MKEIRKKPILLGLGFFIIIISGVFIILNFFQVNFQQTIMDEQKQIMDENRQWAEKITFWEVTGGLGEDIIEGEKMYYDALAKYSAALQAQTISIFFIIMLSVITVAIAGSLIIKLY